MSALAAAAIGGLAISGFEVYQGEKQKAKANQINKNNNFTPEIIPAETKLATRLAQENFTNGMPGMNTAKQQIGQNAINAGTIAAKGATSGADLIDSANKIQLNSDDASRQLALQAASYKSNALGGYEAALGNQAGWQDKLYQNNQLQPYLRAANTASSLEGAGNINEFQGLDNASTAAQTGLQDYQNQQYKKKMGLDTNSILALSALLK